MIPDDMPAPGEDYRAARLRVEACVDRAALRARNRCLVRGTVRWKTYRGRWQVVVGYQWSRPQSHHLRGTVYDAVIACGSTFAEAIAKAEGGAK